MFPLLKLNNDYFDYNLNGINDSNEHNNYIHVMVDI